MAGPVQHLTVFVSKTDSSSDDTAGLNTDRPSGYANAWTDDPVTDPSSNNVVDGPTLIRNQLVSGVILPRVLRDGGSARPQYRVPGTPPSCVCRTFHVASGFEEGYEDFSICDDYAFPYDFTADATIGSWAFDPLIAPGPSAPSLAEVQAIVTAAGAPGTPFDDYDDVPC